MNVVVDKSQFSKKTQQVWSDLLALPNSERAMLINALSNMPENSINTSKENSSITSKSAKSGTRLASVKVSEYSLSEEKAVFQQSDVRNVQLHILASQLFVDASKATEWMKTELAIFDGKTPLEMAKTNNGYQQVKTLISQIEHGVMP